jgi:hypothetical protein
MGIIKKTIYQCDRCGVQSEDKSFNDGSQTGRAQVTISGHAGGKSYDGSWGGASYEHSALLCFSCASVIRVAYLHFMNGGKIQQSQKEPETDG